MYPWFELLCNLWWWPLNLLRSWLVCELVWNPSRFHGLPGYTGLSLLNRLLRWMIFLLNLYNWLVLLQKSIPAAWQLFRWWLDSPLGMKTVRIFSDRIRDQIRLEGFRSLRIRVRISNIRYRIRIRILKSHIYDVDIQSYPIRHGWHYPYSNPNPTRNMKTNVISVISVRIRSVFIPAHDTLSNK
jgi:hypothetical protein